MWLELATIAAALYADSLKNEQEKQTEQEQKDENDRTRKDQAWTNLVNLASGRGGGAVSPKTNPVTPAKKMDWLSPLVSTIGTIADKDYQKTQDKAATDYKKDVLDETSRHNKATELLDTLESEAKDKTKGDSTKSAFDKLMSQEQWLLTKGKTTPVVNNGVVTNVPSLSKETVDAIEALREQIKKKLTDLGADSSTDDPLGLDSFLGK